MTKQILIESCSECQFRHYVGHDYSTHKDYYGCIKLFGGPWENGYLNYNRNLYNHTIDGDKIRDDCPLEDVIS